MNLLDFTRDQVKGYSEMGVMHKKSVFHYDICVELKKGTSHERIAERFNITELRLVSYIKKRKCPDCM